MSDLHMSWYKRAKDETKLRFENGLVCVGKLNKISAFSYLPHYVSEGNTYCDERCHYEGFNMMSLLGYTVRYGKTGGHSENRADRNMKDEIEDSFHMPSVQVDETDYVVS